LSDSPTAESAVARNAEVATLHGATWALMNLRLGPARVLRPFGNFQTPSERVVELKAP